MLLTLNPYPLHYKGAFAFSVFLYLLLCHPCLRLGFPEGEQQAYHVPCRYPCDLGSAYYAESSAYPAPDEFGASGLDSLPFLVQVYQQFSPVRVNDACGNLLGLAISHDPSPRQPFCWVSSSLFTL